VRGLALRRLDSKDLAAPVPKAGLSASVNNLGLLLGILSGSARTDAT
jgi:hypothetical protein